jgi:phosphopantetheinyl transferase
LAGCPKFQFNISYTKNIIALCISEKPIGIDVEKKTHTILKLQKDFFVKMS